MGYFCYFISVIERFSDGSITIIKQKSFSPFLSKMPFVNLAWA